MNADELEKLLVGKLIKLQELYALLLDTEKAQSYRDPKEYYRTVNRDIKVLEATIELNRKRYLMIRM